MAARRYEISLLMLKQYVTASSKAYPSFSVGFLLIIPLLRKAWTKFLQVRVNLCFSYKIMHAESYLACEQQTHFRSSLFNSYFSEGEKRRPEMRLLFAG